eukprot:sb/3476930/
MVTTLQALQLIALNKPPQDVSSCKFARDILLKEHGISVLEEVVVASDQGQSIDSSIPYLVPKKNSVQACAEMALLILCQRYHQFPLKTSKSVSHSTGKCPGPKRGGGEQANQ